MSESDNFLSRWSKRKREAERDDKAETGRDVALRSHEPPPHELPQSVRPRESGDPVPDNLSAESGALDSRVRGNERRRDLASTEPDFGEAGKEPEFDLSKLPSIDTITSSTDISVFLQKGVPSDLTRAALRRAWVADPGIRDFIGLAENQYDFITGSDLPGFGALDMPVEELRKLVAEVFGETQQPLPIADADAEKTRATDAQPTTEPDAPSQSEDVAADNHSGDSASEPSMADSNSVESIEMEFAATQHNVAEHHEEPPLLRRTHGRALPQ
jgi:hypothetical protein